MEILKSRYDAKQLSYEDYEERRLILEGGCSDDYKNSELTFLKEKYARSEISLREYIERRNQIIGSKQGQA